MPFGKIPQQAARPLNRKSTKRQVPKMQAIRRKLNSQKGASMLMALLLMLVGIMVSAVIISAATSAAVNKRSEKEQQQAYLAVSSAAELVRDDFQSLTGRYKDVTTTVTHADGTTTTTNDTIKATCAVGDMINDIGARFIGCLLYTSDAADE